MRIPVVIEGLLYAGAGGHEHPQTRRVISMPSGPCGSHMDGHNFTMRAYRQRSPCRKCRPRLNLQGTPSHMARRLRPVAVYVDDELARP